MRWGAAASPYFSSGGDHAPHSPRHIVGGGMRGAALLSVYGGGGASPHCSGMRAVQATVTFVSNQGTVSRMLMEREYARNLGQVTCITSFTIWGGRGVDISWVAEGRFTSNKKGGRGKKKRFFKKDKKKNLRQPCARERPECWTSVGMSGGL